MNVRLSSVNVFVVLLMWFVSYAVPLTVPLCTGVPFFHPWMSVPVGVVLFPYSQCSYSWIMFLSTCAFVPATDVMVVFSVCMLFYCQSLFGKRDVTKNYEET